jgi:hypothetical protein
LLHRNAICCTETPFVAQKCSNDSMTKDADERQFALVPRLPTASPGETGMRPRLERRRRASY